MIADGIGRCNGEGAAPDTTCTLGVDKKISLRGFRIIQGSWVHSAVERSYAHPKYLWEIVSKLRNNNNI